MTSARARQSRSKMRARGGNGQIKDAGRVGERGMQVSVYVIDDGRDKLRASQRQHKRDHARSVREACSRAQVRERSGTGQALRLRGTLGKRPRRNNAGVVSSRDTLPTPS